MKEPNLKKKRKKEKRKEERERRNISTMERKSEEEKNVWAHVWSWVSDRGSHKVTIFTIISLKLSFQLLKTPIWCFQFSSLSLKIFEFEWWNNIWKSSQTKKKIVWVPRFLITQLWVLDYITQNSSKPNRPLVSYISYLRQMHINTESRQNMSIERSKQTCD